MDKSEENFLAEKTVGELYFGDTDSNPDPAKLYKIPGEQYVYVHYTKHNRDSVSKLQDNGLLHEGLNRYRYPDGEVTAKNPGRIYYIKLAQVEK